MDMQVNAKKMASIGLLAMLPLAALQAAPEVKSVTFGYSSSKAKETKFQVKYSNGNYQSLTPSVVMKLGDGHVSCEKHTAFGGAKLYLGSPWYVNNSIADNGAFVDSNVLVTETTYVGNQAVTEANPQGLRFDINLAQVSKQIFDPVQVVKDELAKAKNQGMSEVDFLKQDRLFEVKRKVTLAGRCYGNNTQAAMGWEISEKNVSFMVQYQGDPNVKETPVLGLQAPAKPKLGFQQGKINLKVTDGNILTNSLNYSNLNCPANLDFSVKYKGVGKGRVVFHVIENNRTVYESAPSEYEAADGWVQKNFKVNVPASPQNMNSKVQSKFSLSFRVRDQDGNSFDWVPTGNFQGLNWSHTCKAKVAVPMGQGGVIYAPNTPKPGMQIKAQPSSPQPPVTPANVQAQPTPPVQAPLQIKAQPSSPRPPVTPANIQAQPRPPVQAPLQIKAQPVEPQTPVRQAD
jgi:hypothetical protein